MSGLVKGIGKVFKKVGKFVKKNWKYIAMAVAVYFTAGVALSYFGATSAFAAAMPGFGTGGLFTSAASAIGLSGPAIAGAAADAGISISAFAAAAASAGYESAAALAAAQAAGEVTVVAATSNGMTVGVVAPNMSLPVGTTTSVAKGATLPASAGTWDKPLSRIPSTSESVAKTMSQTGTEIAAKTGTEIAAKTGGEAAGQGLGGLSEYEKAILKSMDRTTKTSMVITAANTAAGLLEKGEQDSVAFATNRKGKSYDISSNAFAGMNRNTWGNNPLNAPNNVPQSSQYAQEGGGDQFLSTPFDAGEQDYNPQAAKEFIAQMG